MAERLAESLNGRFRDAFLNTELFSTPTEAQLPSDQWQRDHNTHELRLTSSTGRTQRSRVMRPWEQLNWELQHGHNQQLSFGLDRSRG